MISNFRIWYPLSIPEPSCGENNSNANVPLNCTYGELYWGGLLIGTVGDKSYVSETQCNVFVFHFVVIWINILDNIYF